MISHVSKTPGLFMSRNLPSHVEKSKETASQIQKYYMVKYHIEKSINLYHELTF